MSGDFNGPPRSSVWPVYRSPISQAGVGISVIALWLGYESPVTTHQYVEFDLGGKSVYWPGSTNPTPESDATGPLLAHRFPQDPVIMKRPPARQPLHATGWRAASLATFHNRGLCITTLMESFP